MTSIFSRSRSAACAVAALLLSPPASVAAPPAAPMLRVAISSDLRSTNPGINRDSVTDWVMIHIVEGLLAIDDTLRPAPMLAESWTISDDGREYSFRLRPDVRFHNDAALRAEHVVWSWNRLLDPRTGWPCRPMFDGTGEAAARIDTIDAPNSHTVRFRLNESNSLFLYRLADVQCQAAVIHPDSLDAQGRWRAPIGTGPYRLRAWQRGRYVELERFEDYSQAGGPASGLAGHKQALIPTIRMIVIPDLSATKLAVLSGEIDIWPMATAAEALPELRRDPNVRLLQEETRDWGVLLIQNRTGPLRNPALRAAIASALDPELITRSTMYTTRVQRPYAMPASSIDAGLLARVPPAYQPERTRTLLQQAGYRDDPIEIDVSRELGTYFNDAIVIHALLKGAGINAQVRSMDWAAQLKRYWQSEYQLSVFGFTGRPAAPMMYAVFVCDPQQRPNCIVHTPRALEILRKMNGAAADAWPALSAQLEMEIARDRSIVGLFAPLRITAMRRGIEGYETWAMGLPRFWGLSLRTSPTGSHANQ